MKISAFLIESMLYNLALKKNININIILIKKKSSNDKYKLKLGQYAETDTKM